MANCGQLHRDPILQAPISHLRPCHGLMGGAARFLLCCLCTWPLDLALAGVMLVEVNRAGAGNVLAGCISIMLRKSCSVEESETCGAYLNPAAAWGPVLWAFWAQEACTCGLKQSPQAGPLTSGSENKSPGPWPPAL